MKRKRKNSDPRKFSPFEQWLRGGDEIWTRGYARRGQYFVPIFERQADNQIIVQLSTIILLAVTLFIWLPIVLIMELVNSWQS